MLNKRLALILVLCISFSAHAAAELLLNPSFETGDKRNPWNEATLPDNWGKDESNGWATWKSNSAQGVAAHSGNHCVVAGSNSDGGYGLWRQTVSADPCRTYQCSVWAKTENWGSPNARAIVDFKNGSGIVLARESMTIFNGSQSSNWTHYSFVTDYSPWGTESIDITLFCDPYGSPMFDDVSLTALSSQVCPDFNNDQKVDIADAVELVSAWLDDINDSWYEEKYDLDDSDQISMGDFSLFGQYWLEERTVQVPVDAVITVNDSQIFQEIDGFGASFTDSSAWIVHEFLDTPDYLALMEDLFDPVTGAGLSYLRQPMGTSDMRRRPDYTYNEVPGDYDMSEFSIAKDQDYIIPVLQKALEINPDVKIMGSPWTAPSWMKSGEWEKYQGGWLTNNPTNYSAYADYFVKYVQAYAAEGIPIDAVTLQNEPLLQIGYPSMFMSDTDQIQLIEYMGPKFTSAGINTKIIAYDHNWDNTAHALSILDDPQAGAIVDGMAWHHYGGDVSSQTTVHNADPTKGTYFTEGAIGTWMHAEGDFDGVLFSSANLLIKTTHNWAKTVVLWNMVMHEIGAGPITPGENGCWTCFGVITVNSTTKAVTKNGSYYGLGHASKFIRPGGKRIASSDTSPTAIKHVAFANTDDSVVVYAINEASSVRHIQINWNGDSLIYPLLGRSVTTFIWPDQPNPTVEIWTTTGDQSKLLSREADVFFNN